MLPEGRENILDLDFQQWLAVRRLQIVKNAEHAFAGALSHRAMQLSFVKRARVELQTSLGGRKGAGGVDVAGALRETDDDIVGWQLRAYAGEDSAKGLNSGVFYRRIVNGALAGVNVFADYEDGDDGDFWRWSIGGDVKNRFGELSANHYFAITDAQMVGGKKAYTREGYDVDIAARIPRLEWAKARIGYYNFKGEFGDEDENGFRAGLDLSPGEGVVFGVEYDGEDGSFGGNISYTHTFGETQQGAQRTGDFNPRAHFYDAVRREYSQRISRTESGGGNIVVNAAIDFGVFGEGVSATVVTMGSFAFPFPVSGAVTATTQQTGSGNATLRQGWELVVGNNAQIVFSRAESSATIVVSRGRGSFNRNGANITLMQIGGAVITLLGTRFEFNADASPPMITLREGELGIGNNVSVVAAQGARVRVGGSVVGCGNESTGNGVSVNCSFGMAGAEADIMTEVTAPAAGNVLVGRYTLAQREGDITASISGAGFTLTRNGANLNIFILPEAAAVPDANAKRVTLRLTDTAGLLSPSVFATVFAVQVNSPGFGAVQTHADVMTAITAPAAGDVTVGRYMIARRADSITASVSGAGFSLVRSGANNAVLDVVISQAAAMTADPAAKHATLHLRDNWFVPPVSMVVFAVNVNPAAIAVGLADGAKNILLANSGNVIIGTLTAGGGFNPDNFSITGQSPNGGFAVQNASVLIIASGNNARTASVTVRADDDNANTMPAELPWTVTVYGGLSAAPVNLLAAAQREVTAHIPKTLGTLSASGGFGNYVFTGGNAQATIVDMSVMVVSATTGGAVTLPYIINDQNADNTPAPLTPPLTFFMTVTAANPLVISANAHLSYRQSNLNWRASVHEQLRLTLDMDALTPPRMITLTVNMAQKIATDNNIAVNASRLHVFFPGPFPSQAAAQAVRAYTISVYENNVMTISGGG